ncbi:hypothetical protein SAMN04488498_103166 [Mesorhizobium albiziae]|uniref:Uncharacterized protein n=1 Tax=Neomesorhizobium albiziae TaxID=335020 RepID=A0A1I3XE78_9HYPH|nr:hypothetical protein [Mesorhizobium albiziae]GLS30521.1 hypothetical protein GCM10007937_22290 [Mesorhizobium albiziae]SFK17814.1 hypothetical protein SAMN04488498_103166 [Mesorhizobium albiziae]
MSANALIKKHLMPLLAGHPDIAVVGRWIMMKPIRHVLRGIVILSREHDNYFAPEWAVTHFCEPVGFFPLNWGDIIHRETPGLFYWNDPEAPAQFVKQIERDILPLFRSIETLDDMVAYLRTKPIPHRDFEIDELRGVSLHAARGDLAAARAKLDDLRNRRSLWCIPGFAEKEVSSVVDALGPLLDAGDRAGIARQLAEWEAMRIAKLPKGMAKIWEPTPFPVEEN